EVADGVLRPVAADEFGPPDSGGPELLGDLRPGPAGPVGDLHVRVEPDAAAGGADAQVELPVLTAFDAFIEAAEGIEDLAPIDAEVGRFGFLRLVTGMVGGAAEADRGHIGTGDGLLERGPAAGEHETAAVRGLGLAQGVDGLLSVFGVEPGVRVDADDHRMPGRSDREVEADRGR